MTIHNKIFMEDRNCTPSLLKELYFTQNYSLKELQARFGVSPGVMNRWFSESEIEKRDTKSRYTINEHFFDSIDTEEKAYWLGFIWCDGYVLKRTRKNVTEYSFKLSLSEKDEDHLYKFRNSIGSDSPIYRYDVSKSAFATDFKESRFRTSNKHMGSTLYHKYGLIPNRHQTDKLISKISEELAKHFIRGVYDAEGSASVYYHQKDGNYKPSLKMGMSFTTYYELLDYIQNHFIEAGLKNNKILTEHRHKDRDQHCLALKYSGPRQVEKILDYLYEDATVYMERKYEKYKEIKLINKNRGAI